MEMAENGANQLEDKSIQGNEKTPAFYKDGAKYWSEIQPTVDGMLGGLGYLTNIDIQASERFLKTLFKLPEPPGKLLALDCGAGIGRITKNLLRRFFEKVDLVDQNDNFIAEAKKTFEGDAKIGELYCCGLQNFVPEQGKYDVIWCQWVLSHLTDEDLKELLKRCRLALKSNGILVIKENCTNGNSIESDDSDSSITRPFAHFMNLFKEVDLKVLQYVKQKNFPKELYPVWAFALRPKTEPNTNTA